MISDEFALMQINRLSGLEKFPRAPEARKELAVALQAVFVDEMSARNAVEDILKNSEFCPKPMHFYKQMKRGRTGCEECGWTGFVDGPTVRRRFGKHEYRTYTSVKRCHCMPPIPEDDDVWSAA